MGGSAWELKIDTERLPKMENNDLEEEREREREREEEREEANKKLETGNIKRLRRRTRATCNNTQ